MNNHAGVAQSVERRPSKSDVAGSSPAACSNFAGVAQLVERWRAKPEVAGSSPARRSKSAVGPQATANRAALRQRHIKEVANHEEERARRSVRNHWLDSGIAAGRTPAARELHALAAHVASALSRAHAVRVLGTGFNAAPIPSVRRVCQSAKHPLDLGPGDGGCGPVPKRGANFNGRNAGADRRVPRVRGCGQVGTPTTVKMVQAIHQKPSNRQSLRHHMYADHGGRTGRSDPHARGIKPEISAGTSTLSRDSAVAASLAHAQEVGGYPSPATKRHSAAVSAARSFTVAGRTPSGDRLFIRFSALVHAAIFAARPLTNPSE